MEPREPKDSRDDVGIADDGECGRRVNENRRNNDCEFTASKDCRNQAILARMQELAADYCDVPKARRGYEEARKMVVGACREQMALIIPFWRKLKPEARSTAQHLREWGIEDEDAVELLLLGMEWLDKLQPKLSTDVERVLDELATQIYGITIE